MRHRQPLRLLLLLAATLAAALPAQAQYTLHDGDLTRLAKILGFSLALILLYGLLALLYWVGVPLLLGAAICLLGNRLDGHYQAHLLAPVGLAGVAWLVGNYWYLGYERANAPVAALTPDVAALVAAAAWSQQCLAGSLLALLAVGAAVLGYFGARQPRPAARPPGQFT